LARREAAFTRRQLTPIDSATGRTLRVDGRDVIQFCSNNYLGLATDPDVVDAARTALGRWGTGAGASRLIAGSLAIHHELEAALAAWKHADAALLFPSGFMANLAVLTTFAGPGDLVVSDKLNHASLLDAAGYSGATQRRYPHRNLKRAGVLLQRHQTAAAESDTGRGDAEGPWRFLVSDSIFSMDGDAADVPGLSDLAAAHDALLVLDEAHACGVFGATGAGLAEAAGVEDVALSVGTLSKALGSMGGFVTGDRAVIDMLINAGRAQIYTTALPPACSAAALAALRIVQRDPARRQRVLELAERVRGALRAMDYDCGESVSPIIPVMMGTADQAMRAAAFLRERDIFVPAIRPPSVAPGAARLRLSLMATHTDGQVERLIAAFGAMRSATRASRP
jgi:8-amino-7-oxononanoate synthase